MKARVTGAVIAALGALAMVTPWLIFPVCKSPEMPCLDARLFETVTGALVIALGLVPVVLPSKRAVASASIGALVAALLVVFFITVYPGVCENLDMRCNYGTRPGMITVGVLLAAAGAIGLALSRKLK